MAVVPVFCENCGTLFGAPNVIGATGAAKVTFVNSRYGPCPKCGGMARILDGTYELYDDVIGVLTAPAWSKEKLEWLEARVAAGRASESAAHGVIQELEDAAPELHAVIQSSIEHGWKLVNALAVILTIVTFVQTMGSPPASEEGLRRTREQIIQELRQHPTSAQPSSDTTPTSRAKGARRKRPPKTHGANKKRRSGAKRRGRR